MKGKKKKKKENPEKMHSRAAAVAIDKAPTEEGEEVKLFHHYQSRLETNTTVRLAVTYLLSG
jgi:hypothetical protein